jgi:hypothetical protein
VDDEIDGDDSRQTRNRRIVVVRPARTRAGAPGDHPARLEHPQIDLTDEWGLTSGDRSGHDQEIGRAARNRRRTGAQRLHEIATLGHRHSAARRRKRTRGRSEAGRPVERPFEPCRTNPGVGAIHLSGVRLRQRPERRSFLRHCPPRHQNCPTSPTCPARCESSGHESQSVPSIEGLRS